MTKPVPRRGRQERISPPVDPETAWENEGGSRQTMRPSRAPERPVRHDSLGARTQTISISTTMLSSMSSRPA